MRGRSESNCQASDTLSETTSAMRTTGIVFRAPKKAAAIGSVSHAMPARATCAVSLARKYRSATCPAASVQWGGSNAA